MTRIRVYGLITILAVTGQCMAQNRSVRPDTMRLNLQECLSMAMQDNLQIVQQELIQDDFRALQQEVEASRFLSHLKLKSQFGLVPDATGNILTDTINSTISELGPYFRIDIEVAQPLYTWGRLSSLRQAARLGVRSQGYGIDAQKNQVSFEVVKLYYGLLLTREVLKVAEDAAQKLESARSRIVEMLDEGSHEVSRVDRYKLDVHAFSLEKQRTRAQNGQELARAALRRALSIPAATQFDLAKGRLRPARARLDSLHVYLTMARRNRPELSQVRDGVSARRFQWQAARAERWPVLALGGRFKWHEAPGRDLTPSNPGLGEDWNNLSGGAAILLRGDINLGISNAKARRAQVAYLQMQRRERWAKQSIELEVTKAYEDALQAADNFTAARRARRAAKAWLRDIHEQHSVGAAETRELLEAYTAYSTTEGGYFETVYRQRVSMAKLDQAVGNPVWTYTDKISHIGVGQNE